MLMAWTVIYILLIFLLFYLFYKALKTQNRDITTILSPPFLV